MSPSLLALEAAIGGGAGVSVLGGAVLLSLNLKLSEKLKPGDIVVHTEDDSEPWWTVAAVWFYGIKLIGNSGRVKYLRTRDYRLLNNVSGPAWVEVEVAIPAEDVKNTTFLTLEERLKEAVIQAGSAYLATTERNDIVVLLDNVETTLTFALKFQITNFTDKRLAAALVRRALLVKGFKFADRAVLAANITLPSA